MSAKLSFSRASEHALIIYIDGIATADNNLKLCQLEVALRRQFKHTLLDAIVSYNSLFIEFDFMLLDEQQLIDFINNSYLSTQVTQFNNVVHQLPVYYGPEFGLDFDYVCDTAKITAAELIQLHSARPYHVYSIGFAPGFAFLGHIDDRLHLPRRSSPRASVEAGSLAIAESQTAVYPTTTPGGWHLIGRCPLTTFNLKNQPPTPFKIGDSVQFTPISKSEYQHLMGSQCRV